MTNVVLLSGIVGSRAYGLARPDSDTDRLSVHVRPTDDFLGLTLPQMSHVRQGTEGDDNASHEVGKFLHLALSCNPTASEILWLPDEMYEIRTADGDDLIGMRSSFLHARGVRNSYLGYAHAQAKRCRRDFATPGRQEKAARHTWRLVKAGQHLWETGELLVRLPNPQACLDFGAAVASGRFDLLDELMASAETVFEKPTPLPNGNDAGWKFADNWLRTLRRRQLKG